MTNLFEVTTYIFKAINPAKKYSQFTYYDAEFEHINIGDCFKGTILKIDGTYYLYGGEKSTALSVRIPSTIVFKNGKTLIKSIPA